MTDTQTICMLLVENGLWSCATLWHASTLLISDSFHIFICSTQVNATQTKNKRSTQAWHDLNKWVNWLHCLHLNFLAWFCIKIPGLIQSEWRSKPWALKLQKTSWALVFKRQMIKNSQAGDEQRSPVLEVGEMERPFQTTVPPLPLCPHLSYFADSTFKWHGSASVSERVWSSFTFVTFHSYAFRQFTSMFYFFTSWLL